LQISKGGNFINVGEMDGIAEGFVEGLLVGHFDGLADGEFVGLLEGFVEGALDGCDEGLKDGFSENRTLDGVGFDVGFGKDGLLKVGLDTDGIKLKYEEGFDVGLAEGFLEG
jgi:hypothetical protein